MNKTESVRESKELRDLGSSLLPKSGSSRLTNFDSVSRNASMAGGVPDFHTPSLTDSVTLYLPNSESSALTNGVSS